MDQPLYNECFMDRFARLFTLQFQLRDSKNRNTRLGKEEQWRVIDRTIVLFGPPAIVNSSWSIGMLDFPSEEEEAPVELMD
ncbi:MAG: hypothetical protein HQL94_01990 [Magnetococcales bacterium]|nr:hypothetical protein [Magnetococcales bacterium]MBF0438975.1 hypothetical protein [Magnetococcales bacterium]